MTLSSEIYRQILDWVRMAHELPPAEEVRLIEDVLAAIAQRREIAKVRVRRETAALRPRARAVAAPREPDTQTDQQPEEC